VRFHGGGGSNQISKGKAPEGTNYAVLEWPIRYVHDRRESATVATCCDCHQDPLKPGKIGLVSSLQGPFWQLCQQYSVLKRFVTFSLWKVPTLNFFFFFFFLFFSSCFPFFFQIFLNFFGGCCEGKNAIVHLWFIRHYLPASNCLLVRESLARCTDWIFHQPKIGVAQRAPVAQRKKTTLNTDIRKWPQRLQHHVTEVRGSTFFLTGKTVEAAADR